MQSLILLISCLVAIQAQTNFQWLLGSFCEWAHGCDFRDNDLSNVRAEGSSCSDLCAARAGCTNFAWNNFNGGTCWLKGGSLSKNQAIATNSENALCGVMTRSGNGRIAEVWTSDPGANRMLQRQSSVIFGPDSSPIYLTVTVNDQQKYQVMDGFGASLTDASTWLLKYRLNDAKQREVLEALFGRSGINLNILRQVVGASDFGWEAWTYDDSATDDFSMSKFSLWREDDYIWPILSKALQVNPGRLRLFAAPWSPPAWMKTQRNLFGGHGGVLRQDCYDAYADYLIRYLQDSAARGAPIYALSVQNEPQYAPYHYPGMLMNSNDQNKFISRHLGPKLDSKNLKHTKIYGFDHNFDDGGVKYAYDLLRNHETSRYLTGIGFHTYTSPGHDKMSEIHNAFPNKDVWITESGSGTWIGNNAEQFKDQLMHIIRSPRNWAKGVILWNVALDQSSSPKLAGVDPPGTNRALITIRSDARDSVTYEMGYYSLGHTTKFIENNAIRIGSNDFRDNVENVAYYNPDGTIVVVLSNRRGTASDVHIKWNNQVVKVNVPANGAATVKWSTR